MKPVVIWRDTNTGDQFFIRSYAIQANDLTQSIVYESVKTRQVWVCPESEFMDGRFVKTFAYMYIPADAVAP